MGVILQILVGFISAIDSRRLREMYWHAQGIESQQGRISGTMSLLPSAVVDEVRANTMFHVGSPFVEERPPLEASGQSQIGTSHLKALATLLLASPLLRPHPCGSLARIGSLQPSYQRGCRLSHSAMMSTSEDQLQQLAASAELPSFPRLDSIMMAPMNSLSFALDSLRSSIEQVVADFSGQFQVSPETAISSLTFTLHSLRTSIQQIATDFSEQFQVSPETLERISKQVDSWIVSIQILLKEVAGEDALSFDTLVSSLEQTLQTILFVLPLSLSFLGVLAILSLSNEMQGSVYPKGTYDPAAARAYFIKQPGAIVLRLVSIFLRSLGFVFNLLVDTAFDKEQSHGEQRAGELAQLLAELGPTFVKAGQAASIRGDLLPAAYIRGLTQLQDEVPPFPSVQAKAIINEEFGSNPPFARLSDEPIAAASLGQVYKGTLFNGTDVAVKVQRPEVERTIALDMFLIRDILAPLASQFGVRSDLIGIVDEWGKGFVDELNYVEEAANAVRFNRDVADSPLNGSVFAPCVVSEASSRRVLTTVWIDGERLDRCRTPDDVPRLCSLAMNTYMEMLLDSGSLHCDPHPGNLLRTPDGKLCILDWGLVACVRPDIQLSLIEHVAHLTAKDYDKVPSDLVKLEFVPEGAEEAVMENGVMEFLTRIYSLRGLGGGLKKFDVPKVFSEFRALAAGTERGLFQIPPYFAYIAKAFSVLEGIGLSADPDYNVIDETLPYISRRILTDPSPRTAGALETFIFGDDKKSESRVFDADRVEVLIDGTRRYAASMLSHPQYKSQQTPEATESASSLNSAGFEIDAAVDTLFDVLLSKESTPLQDIVLEQFALIVSASLRELWADVRASSGKLDDSNRSRLGFLVDPLGLFDGSPLVEPDARDQRVLAATSKLTSIAIDLLTKGSGMRSAHLPGATFQPNDSDLAEFAKIISDKLWLRRDAVQLVSQRLGVKFLEQTLHRVRRRGV